MNPTLTLFAVSLTANVAFLILWARAERTASRWQDRHDALHRVSHRRDPRTGRLMPMGE